MSAAPEDPIRLAPAAGGQAERLVILLHGVGATARDLIGIANGWRTRFPGTAFAALDGTEPFDGSGWGGARQWFSIRGITEASRPARVAAAATMLAERLDQERNHWGVAWSQVVLVGFSQGTIMALRVALAHAEPIGGVIGYSGRLAVPPDFAPASRPPILLVHGTDDGVIPPAELGFAESALSAWGVPVEARLLSGVGHTISPDGLRLGAGFLEGLPAR